ncbi:MAG: hypothetical protein PHD82_15530 [Candidatus Riflebacteria bacterium]|nr:hypothetical protein [Candidatus Riflebacteria bacterium]
MVTSVSPYALIPTATDTASLPTTEITVLSQSKVPCSLKSLGVNYYTAFGDEITSLAVNNQQIEMKVDAEAELVIGVSPYSAGLVDLFELSSSQISPVKAKISMNFLDINGNWVSLDAHCLLYRYEPPETAANRKSDE